MLYAGTWTEKFSGNVRRTKTRSKPENGAYDDAKRTSRGTYTGGWREGESRMSNNMVDRVLGHPIYCDDIEGVGTLYIAVPLAY